MLKGIEYATSRGLKGVELRDKIKKLMSQHMESVGTEAGVRTDVVSHHILRLAYAGSEDKRRWFLTQEVALFRYATHCFNVPVCARRTSRCWRGRGIVNSGARG